MRITELDTAWLAAALKVDASRITNLESSPVGTGQVADTHRLSFQLDGTPGSRILKLTPESAVSRETGRRQACYLREVRFYQDLAPTVAVRVPRLVDAGIDDSITEFHLLLEDMTPCSR
jgi:hypothetical protein